MKVRVVDVYEDKARDFQGNERQVIHQLLKAYAFLRPYKPGETIEEMVKRINRRQIYMAAILERGPNDYIELPPEEDPNYDDDWMPREGEGHEPSNPNWKPPKGK